MDRRFIKQRQLELFRTYLIYFNGRIPVLRNLDWEHQSRVKILYNLVLSDGARGDIYKFIHYQCSSHEHLDALTYVLDC